MLQSEGPKSKTRFQYTNIYQFSRVVLENSKFTVQDHQAYQLTQFYLEKLQPQEVFPFKFVYISNSSLHLTKSR